MTGPGQTQTASLLSLTVAALQDGGRLVRTNWDLETFDVLPEVHGAQPVLGVIMGYSQAVVFYSAWPQDVPEELRTAVMEFVTRANENLYTCAFEFNLENGGLALRAGVEFGDGYAAMPREVLGDLLGNALDEVEASAGAHVPAVDAVLAGVSPLEALAKVQ